MVDSEGEKLRRVTIILCKVGILSVRYLIKPQKILSQQNMSLSQSNLIEIKAIQIRFLPS